ncbi:hypothetical protein HGA91_02765 [candidate division WWE3 bacterium]|nr:hypothetical protein [candidate division WWE3 bacterium]
MMVSRNLIKYSFITLVIILLVILGMVTRQMFIESGFKLFESNKAIMKVGNETIYQSDYDYEKQYAPPLSSSELKTYIEDKLIKDSIILQGASDDQFILLKESFYNSPNKNYATRIQEVEKIRKDIEERSSAIKGEFAVAWFYNSNSSGPYTYEESQKIVEDKINALYKRVSNNSLSVEDAAKEIRNDKILQEIDPAVASNALLTFTVDADTPITRDEQLNTKLRSLTTGQLSPILTLKTLTDRGPDQIESAYLFGTITEKTSSYTTLPFSKWYDLHKENYTVNKL